METAIAIRDFEKTLNHYSTSSKRRDLEDLLDVVEKVRGQNPQVFSDDLIGKYLKDRANVLQKLVEEYFVKAMSTQFPLLSDDLFKLKRHLTIEKKGKSYTIVADVADDKTESKKATKMEVPLFAYVPLFKGEHKVELGKLVKRSYDGYGYEHKTTTKIYATLPGSIGTNLRQAYRESLSHYHRTVAEILENPLIGEVVTQKNLLSEPEVGAIWIPTPESLDLQVTQEIIDRRPKITDPAMIIRLHGKSYLVKTWKVDDEEPFEHYLREYSLGDLKEKA